MNKTTSKSNPIDDGFDGFDDDNVDAPPTKSRGRGRGRGRARGTRGGRGSRGDRGASKAASSRDKGELDVTQKTQKSIQSCKFVSSFNITGKPCFVSYLS